jgi:hypothetical protein
MGYLENEFMAQSMLLMFDLKGIKSPHAYRLKADTPYQEAPLHSEKERKKILIVDDELDMRIFLCNLLGN